MQLVLSVYDRTKSASLFGVRRIRSGYRLFAAAAGAAVGAAAAGAAVTAAGC